MLDPADWESFRAAAHRALDDAVDYLRDVRERPAWQPVPQSVKAELAEPLPADGAPFAAVYAQFARAILPYVTGNIHPRFWGWVHGSGTPGVAVAELLAATMNANVGGRDHAAVYVERQVIAWFRELFGLPGADGGVLLTGTSAANLVALLAARTRALGSGVRKHGVYAGGERLRAYASSATHACVRKAFEMAGLGSDTLRVLPADAAHRLDLQLLRRTVESDINSGLRPFFVVANAGSVDAGAIDDLAAVAGIASAFDLWFHVDGAFGAAACLSPRLQPKFEGIERADSIAFDFHKWLHVPYDAGCVLIRDSEIERATFAGGGPYFTRMPRGTGAGEPWFADYGPDLSRGFRALKIWFTIKEHGASGLARAIERNCDQARTLYDRLTADPDFEPLLEPELQIVCFRPRGGGLEPAQIDRLIDESVMSLQESGVAVISTTTIGGRRAMRLCITNHRTEDADLEEALGALRSIVRDGRDAPT
ncbi:MAG TPA: pyridoxal-dependent decarboxylase [Candidatus Baltobacteraceae bacterium]|nr:pyridoxal-dependent decarboxylase [Candidatus Baltobacteraceae bacterium]